MSHTHAQLTSHKNYSWLLFYFKRKCLFQNVLYKSSYTILHVERSPLLSPVPGLQTVKTSNTLRGRGLPQALLQSLICIFTCNGSVEDLVSNAQLGSVLKGQFLPGSTK